MHKRIQNNRCCLDLACNVLYFSKISSNNSFRICLISLFHSAEDNKAFLYSYLSFFSLFSSLHSLFLCFKLDKVCMDSQNLHKSLVFILSLKILLILTCIS